MYRTQREGQPGLAGSIAGALGVSTPVLFAVMTTIAAFTPLMLVPGPTGKIFRVIPLIVIPTLVFSLIESLFILPNHLSHSTKETHTNRLAGGWARFQDRFASGLERFILERYRPFLRRALDMRYVTVSAFIGVFILTIGAVAGGLLRFTFFPPVEADYVIAMLTMPQGTPAERTAAAVERLESAARDLQREIDGDVTPLEGSFRHMLASVGEQPYRAEQEQNGPGGRATSYVGSHYGEVTIELARAEDRELSSGEIAQLWRERVGTIPDALELKLTASLFSPGAPIDIQLTDPDVDRLRAAADALKEKLATYGGVFDIADSYRAGKEEIVLPAHPRGRAARRGARRSRPPGAAGLLRRGGSASTARSRRRQGDGAIPIGCAALACRAGRHARAHHRRSRGAVLGRRRGGVRTRLRDDHALGSPAHAQRHRRRGSVASERERDHRRSPG